MSERLFYDDWQDAARAVIQAAGGTKRAAGRVFPQKSGDAAERLLRDCLNENRSERPDPEALVRLLQLGREAGCHALMHFLAQEAGYKADPVEPRDELAALQRDYIEAVRALGSLSERMERLMRAPVQSVK